MSPSTAACLQICSHYCLKKFIFVWFSIQTGFNWPNKLCSLTNSIFELPITIKKELLASLRFLSFLGQWTHRFSATHGQRRSGLKFSLLLFTDIAFVRFNKTWIRLGRGEKVCTLRGSSLSKHPLKAMGSSSGKSDNCNKDKLCVDLFPAL